MKRALITSFLVFCVSSLVIAEDLVPPSWANEPNSTLTRQVWEFSSDSGSDPFWPDEDQNPFGTASITIGGSGIIWQASGGYPAHGVDLKSGVIQASMPGDYMEIYIPNQQDTQRHTEVWIQLTFATLNPNAEAQIDPEILLSYSAGVTGSVERSDFYQITSLVDEGGTGAMWYQLAEEWIITPQPESETYRISLDSLWPVGTPLWLDGVVVYTRCLPVPVLLEGDANRDGVVSAGDYASVQANFGNVGAAGILGDANLDGVVSAGDYASVQANFGNVAAAAVPEPMTLSLLALSGAALISRKRK